MEGAIALLAVAGEWTMGPHSKSSFRRKKRRSHVPVSLTYPGVYVQEIPSGVTRSRGLPFPSTRSSDRQRAGRTTKRIPPTAAATLNGCSADCHRENRHEPPSLYRLGRQFGLASWIFLNALAEIATIHQRARRHPLAIWIAQR